MVQMWKTFADESDSWQRHDLALLGSYSSPELNDDPFFSYRYV